MSKWVKVYVGPGYPMDPRRVLRVRQIVVDELHSIATDVDAYITAATLAGIPPSAPLFQDGVRTPHEIRVSQQQDPTSFESNLNEIPGGQTGSAFVRQFFGLPPQKPEAKDPSTMTDEEKTQLMDHLQARAREWTRRFNHKQDREWTLAAKMERREIEQYQGQPESPPEGT